MKNISKVFAVCVLASALAACGTSRGDRIASGAALGAATGAVVGTMSAGSPTTGALIGAGVGGAAGGIIDSSHINLGKPLWNK